jgi:hypothetical protein
MGKEKIERKKTKEKRVFYGEAHDDNPGAKDFMAVLLLLTFES